MLGTIYSLPSYLYIYIYIIETFEAPTIFHVSTVLKKKNFSKTKKQKTKKQNLFENPIKTPDKNQKIKKHNAKKKKAEPPSTVPLSSLFVYLLHP